MTETTDWELPAAVHDTKDADVQPCESSTPVGLTATRHGADAADQPPQPPAGTVFMEARISDEVTAVETLAATIENIVSTHIGALDLWQDLTQHEIYSADIPPGVLSLKATGYDGPPLASPTIPIPSMRVCVNVYGFRDEVEVLRSEDESFLGEIVELPTQHLDEIWERLVVDEDLRNSLTRMASNLLAFSRKRQSGRSSRVNPLILFYGPPGSGKTSLSLGLAQTLSIRLNKVYSRTRLIQLNGGNLLSKYFGESSQLVTRIFQRLEDKIRALPRDFMCILIDEVESIANCRAASSANNELMDSIRATNALLTALDRMRKLPNVLIVCSSNLRPSLDAAFLSRCSLHVHIAPPAPPARYEILRAALNDLIDDGIVRPVPPHYRLVPHRFTILEPPPAPSARALAIADRLVGDDLGSGRTIGQLSELALAVHLRQGQGCCSLDEALALIEEFARDFGRRGEKRKADAL